MRTTMVLVLMAVVATGCVASGERSTMQEVAAPSVTVAPRSASELAVSWTADPMAVRYSVLEGGALAASVFDSSGGAPATSWIATDLDAGEHCYSVRSVYADGSTSDLSAAACAAAGSSSTPPTRTIAIPLAPSGEATSLDGTMLAPFMTTKAGQPNAMFVAGFMLPRGSHVLRIRASVADGASCRLAATLGLAGGAGAGVFALGPASDGSGDVQTIQSPPLDVALSATNAYYAVLRTVAGTAACSVFWIEVDYQGWS